MVEQHLRRVPVQINNEVSSVLFVEVPLAVVELPRSVNDERTVRSHMTTVWRGVGEADACQYDQDHCGECDHVEGRDDVVGPIHHHDERTEETDGAQRHGHRLVAYDEIRIHSRPRAAHNRDEHGEGRVDQVQVDEERDEEGGEVQNHPLPVPWLPLGRRLIIETFKDASVGVQRDIKGFDI